MKTPYIALSAAILATLTLAGCSTATPTDTPGVDRLGEYLLEQKGPELDSVLGYRFASSSISDDWLMLELAITAPNGQSTKIERSNIWVRTPDGTKLPLATQTEFGEAYRDLRATVKKADVARDPMGYFPPARIECELRFFTPPGEQVVFEEVTVDDRRACQGRLYFKVPGGIQPGKWIFGIDLEESEVRIPFNLAS